MNYSHLIDSPLRCVLRVSRKIVWVLSFLMSAVFLQAQDYTEFEDLYPNCQDNYDSKIYGGTYGNWPEALNLPVFPHGGDIELTRYVRNNIEYPHVVESYEQSVDGKDSAEVLAKGIVAVQVVIDRCGKPSRVEVIQSVNDAYDEEALRIARGLPTFKPGDLYGERVKVALIIPFYFTRTKMPPPPESEYGDFWGDGGDNVDWSDSEDDDSSSSSGGGKYDNVQWDDSW